MKPIYYIAGFFIFLITFSFFSMVYNSYSAKINAEDTCAIFSIGEIFDENKIQKKKPIIDSTGLQKKIVYMYMMNFDQVAFCQIIVDGEGIVTDVQFYIQ